MSLFVRRHSSRGYNGRVLNIGLAQVLAAQSSDGCIHFSWLTVPPISNWTLWKGEVMVSKVLKQHTVVAALERLLDRRPPKRVAGRVDTGLMPVDRR